MSEERSSPDDVALAHLRELSRMMMQLPRPWTWLMVIGAVLSTVHLDITAKHEVSGSVAVSPLAALFLALIWLPPLLRILGIAGGGVKTPAGEATTPGLAQLFQPLDADTKRVTLPSVITALSSAEVLVNPKTRRESKALRRDLELQLAAVTPAHGGVRETLDRYAREYEIVRDEMDPGRDRTMRMTTLTAEARAVARATPLSTTDLQHMLASGSDGEGVIALAIAQDQPDPRLIDLIADAIANSRSAFEQYQALGAAYEALPALSDDRRQLLAGVLRTALEDTTRDIRADTSRRRLVEAMLECIDG